MIRRVGVLAGAFAHTVAHRLYEPKLPERRRFSPPLRAQGLGFQAFLVILVGVGLAARVMPLLDYGNRLLRHFPIDDGYLMLTIARNIAIGKGMSIADGTIPTNGSQPLCTLLWALGYWLVEGDKRTGVLVVLVASVVVSSLGAYALFRLAPLVFGQDGRAHSIGALAAAIWYASPRSLPHTMNCLETGTHALIVVLTVHAFVAGSRDPNARWSLLRCVGMGALLGLAFWARNDAVFLVLAACLTRCVSGLRLAWAAVSRRTVETVLMGGVCLAIASPWLIHNHIKFGSIVPVSGAAQTMGAPLGACLGIVPVRLLEYASVIFTIPTSVELSPTVILVCTLCVGVIVVGVIFETYRKGGPMMRTLLSLVGIYAVLLSAYYGTFSSAGWFIGRYLFPLSPFLALLWARVALDVWGYLRRGLGAALAGGVPCLLVAIVIGLSVRGYVDGPEFVHFQMTDWVKGHVSDDVWIGAGQSGTTGYFHDRTINLDGKVNPEALDARLRGELPRYILEKNIRYLVDWLFIARYADLPELKPHFVIEVQDAERNLAVLRRITQPPS